LPITIVTTSNDPTSFSERLIRPNRISKILIFNRPSLEEKKIMLNNHLKSNNIKLSKNLLKTIYESKVFIN
jgi:SpoVK/Ycf46/Vps4 family AAA+-type ATPase